MSVNITVKSPYKKEPYKISITNAESLNSIKQYLISLGQIQQPITCFSLFKGDTKLDTFATIEELGIQDNDQLKMVPQDYTLGEITSHIQQTRELLGFVPDVAPYEAVNSGAVNINNLKVKRSSKKGGERALTDAPDLPDMPVLHYEFKPEPAALTSAKNDLLPHPVARTLHFSCWQPPTFANKLKGHLAYVKFVAQDHKVFHITAAVDGFTVNSSTDDKFDASPKRDGAHHVSLLHLIGLISPRTLNSVERMNNQLAKLSPQTWTLPRASYLCSPWLVDSGVAAPSADLARTQSLLMDRDSSALKDWNEDFQTTRELPKTDEEGNPTIRDRIIREKLIVNTCHDFACAATRGALDILNGNMQPFNPDEAAENQIFLRNGIFYTLAFDSVGVYADLGGDEAARVAANKDLRGVEQLITLDLDSVTPVLTAVIDYCGRRIIAQGPVPGIFRENADPQILYGSAEGRSQVFADSEIEPEMTKIANAFHLKKHTAFDAEGQNTVSMVTSVDMKCMNGSDGRKYVLDCARVSPTDIGFLEEHTSYPHQLAFIRPEAVAEWFRAKVKADLEKQGEGAKLDEQQIAKYQEEFVVNPDVYLKEPSSLTGEYEADRKTVKEVSEFIKSTLIPQYINDIAQSNTVYPIDGAQLTEGMHRRGISMRHLGYLHAEAKEYKEHDLQPLIDVISRDAIARAVKHLVNSVARPLPLTKVQGAIVEFLQTIESKTSDIAQQVQARFGFEVEVSKYLNRQLLREIAVKLGLQLDSSVIGEGDVKWAALNKQDLVCFVPVVRYATIQSAIPEEALTAGRVSVQNNKEEGLDIIKESLSLHEQVYGTIHPETAKAYNQASLVYHEVQDYNTASDLCRKAIAISERVNGIDSAETIVMYINLGFYERIRGNVETSLDLLKHVLDLWVGIGSVDHPDMLNTMQSIAAMLFQGRFYKECITWFDRAIELAEKNGDKASSAPLYLQVSQAHVILNSSYATATRCAEKAFAIYKSTKGPEDDSTKECKKWLDQLVNATVRDLKAQKLQVSLPTTTAAPTLKQKKEHKKKKTRGVDDIVNYIMSDDSGKSKKGKKKKNDKKNGKK